MKWFKYVTVLIIVFILINDNQIIRADTNMDGGGSGGGTQDGTSSNFYSSGDDGVRITIIDIKTKRRAEGTISIDYFRKDKTGKSIIHFGKVSKLEYMGVGGYPTSRGLEISNELYTKNSRNQITAYKVDEIPTIVSSSIRNSNIEKIKVYFNNEDRLRGIANRVGMTYKDLISGDYKLIIEPMIYITYESKYIAMTAHEAAKLDISLGGTTTTGGKLRAKFVSFTHKNLPLSIFLKKKELGVKRWTGSKTERVNNGNILSSLGIGILSFAPEEIEVNIDAGNYTYRPDTDVITSVNVSAFGEDGATCDNPITVRFSGDMINTTDVSGITIPSGGSRLVWMKWHTPNVTSKTATTITAEITGGGTSSTVTISVVINPILEKEPPNPTADDTKSDKWSDENNLPTFPKIGALSKFSSPAKTYNWNTYTCTKRSEWTGEYYKDGNGNKYKIYETVYDFTTNNYSTSLVSTNAKIIPDGTVRAANVSDKEIKSGYGIEMNVTSNVVGSYSDTTGIQTAVVYFPEFNYIIYKRIGKLPRASLMSTIKFPINQYSIYKSRVHFLPIWFPDKEYKIYIETLDAWTPAGMLCDQTTASITVKGSLWDDWHVGVVPELP